VDEQRGVEVVDSDEDKFSCRKMRRLTELPSLKRIAKKNKRKQKKRMRRCGSGSASGPGSGSGSDGMRARLFSSSCSSEDDENDSDNFMLSDIEGPLPFERRISQADIQRRRAAVKGLKRKRDPKQRAPPPTDFTSDSSDVIDTEDEMARLREKGHRLLVSRVERKLADEIGEACNKDECVADVTRVILKHKQGGKRWIDKDEKHSSRYKELIGDTKADVPLVLSRTWKPCLSPEKTKIMEMLGTPDRSRCWACERSCDTTVKSNVSAWINMTRMYREYVGRKDKVALARQLYNYFEQNIRQPANRVLTCGESPIPEWRPIDILEHMEGHSNEPHLRICTVLNHINKMQESLAENVYMCNGTYNSVVRPDISLLNAYIKLTELQMKVYNCKPAEMYGACTTTDMVISESPWVNVEKSGYYGRHPFSIKEASN